MPFSAEITRQQRTLLIKCPALPYCRETSPLSAGGYERSVEVCLGLAWSRVLEQLGYGQTDSRPHLIFTSASSGRDGFSIVTRAKRQTASINIVTMCEPLPNLRWRPLSSRFKDWNSTG